MWFSRVQLHYDNFWYTINEQTTTWFRHNYNNNNAAAYKNRKKTFFRLGKSIRTMMNWAYMIWPLRILISPLLFLDLVLDSFGQIAKYLFFFSLSTDGLHKYFPETGICFVGYKTKRIEIAINCTSREREGETIKTADQFFLALCVCEWLDWLYNLEQQSMLQKQKQCSICDLFQFWRWRETEE